MRAAIAVAEELSFSRAAKRLHISQPAVTKYITELEEMLGVALFLRNHHVVTKNRTGYHNHINSEEVTSLIRELALVCEDGAIVSILNRLGYRTGTGNTWTEKRVQHVRHTKGFPACPPPDHRRWITMRQAASMLRVSEAVVRRLIAQKTLPAKQIVKFAPWVIEKTDLDLPAVHRAIRLVHTGRRDPVRMTNDLQTRMFSNPEERLGEI